MCNFNVILHSSLNFNLEVTIIVRETEKQRKCVLFKSEEFWRFLSDLSHRSVAFRYNPIPRIKSTHQR